MSARSWSGRLALGGGGFEQRALAVVAGEQPALVGDAEGRVRELVNEDGTAHVVQPRLRPGELEGDRPEGHGAVVADDPLMLGGEHEAEFEAHEFEEGAAWLRRRDGEAAIEVRDEGRLQVGVGGRVVRDAGEAELLGEATLECPEGPLTTAARLGGAGEDVADAEGLEGP